MTSTHSTFPHWNCNPPSNRAESRPHRGACRFLPILLLVAGAALASILKAEDPKLVAETEPRSPEEQRKLFHLPPGFEIQLVAAEPQIQKPMNIAFDSRSRLWVTNSVEYPFPAKPGTTPRDSIKILEDRDGDGRADSVKTFADGLNIPIGILPLPGSSGCIAYSIPSIHRFTDRDGDDRSDTRDVLYPGFGFADTHGMSSSYTWGFDGWIYATHGFANNSEVKGSDGRTVKMHSGNTYRFRPDGSRIEQWTWGQVNPFGLTFDPSGNLYSADCHSRPIMMLLRGAYYQSFGKPHDGLGFAPEICTHEHGSTGIAGIVYYVADQFPDEYQDTIFTGNPVTNRINLDRIERHGSTWQAVHQPDFLSCDDPWFRPVDLKLGPDGAIYIADFYNRIIGHYEVPLTHPGRDHDHGRIWRIVYVGSGGTGKRAAVHRDWTKATLDELVDDLGHPNATVRMIALNELVERFGGAAGERLRQVALGDSPAIQQVYALWAQNRLGAMVIRSDVDPLVRAHWLRAVAERESVQPALRTAVLRNLASPDGMVRRAAAEALGRHPTLDNVTPLLALRRDVPSDDPQLLHAVRIALREQLRPDGAFEALAKMSLTDSDAVNIADVVPGVPTAAAADWLDKYLHEHNVSPALFSHYAAHVARHLPAERLPEFCAFAREPCGDDLRRQAAMILLLHDALQLRGARTPEDVLTWGLESGRKLMATEDVASAREAIRIARVMKLEPLADSIARIAAGKKPFESLRPDAISMLAEVQPDRSLALLSGILGDSSEPLPLRQHVANVMGQQQRPEVHSELIRHVRVAPEELAIHIAAALAGQRAGAEKLLEEVATGKVSARVIQHPVVNARLQSTRLTDLEKRIAQLTEGLPPEEERLQQSIRMRRAGYAKATPDRDRGAKLFEKHCAICHTIGDRGAKIGPQLDGVAARGLDRVLEDVLDPNRNVDQAFRSSILALKNGRVLTGLVLNSDGDVVTLTDAQGQQAQIPKSDVEERTFSQLSPMPANVVDLLTESEFYDLLSFLLAQRQPAVESQERR